ncbi:MAG: PilW family protein [Thauera sp.]|jgi:type IV pilus assembly protein PilW
MSSAHESTRTTDRLRGAAPQRRVRGISLVELMVGMTIGLIALLVMVQTFFASQGQKANAVSGADATTAGHIALTLLERDLLNAGAGLSATQCTQIRFFDPALGAVSQNDAMAMPVTISADPNAPTALVTRSDRITIRYVEAADAMMANSTLTASMPSPSSTLFASTGIGFAQGDLVLLHDPNGICAVQQITQDPGSSGRSGGSWRFQINPSSIYNAPGADTGIFPPSGYQAGTGRIMSLGPRGIAEISYQMSYRDAGTTLPNADLASSRRDMTTTGTPPSQTLTRDVIALRAQYGWWDRGTNTVSFGSTVPAGAQPEELAAIRVGIVVRAGQADRSYTAPETISLFAGDNPLAITLGSSERNYRYRTFETVVPLRNTLWNR